MALIIRICKAVFVRKNRRAAMFTIAFPVMSVGMAGIASASVDKDRDMQRYVSARLAQIEQRNDDALKQYLRLFKSSPDSPELADRLFENAIVQGDMKSALRAVRAKELSGDNQAAVYLLRFISAFKNENWAQSDKAISALAEKRNFGFIAPILRSWVNIAGGKPDGWSREEERKSQLLQYYASDQKLYFRLATGNLETAKRQFLPFMRSDTDFARDLNIRAAPIYARIGEDDFARLLLRNRVDADFVGHVLSRKKTLSPNEGIAALFTRLANGLIDQKAVDQALIMARYANWMDGDSDPAKLALARSLFENDFDDKAYLILANIKPNSPYWMRTVNDRAKKLAANNKANEALKLAQYAHQQRPSSANALLLLGQMQEETGKYEDAAQSYAALVMLANEKKMTPGRKALYLLFWATALDKKGDWAGAKLKLNEGKTLAPNNAFILNYLGFSMLERGEDYGVALKYLKNAFQLRPESAAIADSLGWAYLKNEHYLKAIRYLEIAVLKSKNDVTINEHLGDAYWYAGRRVDARYAWKKAAYSAEDEQIKQRLNRKIGFGIAVAASAQK